MDHPNHDLDSPAYRALNPFGQIPVIDDDGVLVSESGAILLYLARKSGKLTGTTASRRWVLPRAPQGA
jgi:glutathione S-transferase